MLRVLWKKLKRECLRKSLKDADSAGRPMQMTKTPYFHLASAQDLSGSFTSGAWGAGSILRNKWNKAPTLHPIIGNLSNAKFVKRHIHVTY
jgi:hypothetical protein